MQSSRSLTPGLAVLAASAAVAFGCIVGIAFAGHYHDYIQTSCGFSVTPHGLVHGGSTSDGVYFSRVEGGYCGSHKLCAIGNNNIHPTNSVRGTETFYVADRCEVQIYGGQVESQGWARTYANTGSTVYISTHYHYAH